MTNSQMWAGQRLGLPENGPGSLAKLGRRTLALLIDWALALAVSQAFAKGDSTITLLVFAIEQWLLIATLGYSIGHRILGLQVRRLDGKYVGFWRSLIRIGLILLIIPATIWDADNRGLHDKAAGTVLVRTR
ncbi:MAG: RDD family protein [Rhodoluna sp.]